MTPPPDQMPPRLAPHLPLPAYYHTNAERQVFLTELFDCMASDYDWIHRVASFGSSMWHRKRALRMGGLAEGMRVLDVACGTGSVAQCATDIVGPVGYVVGLDPSLGMLREVLRRRICTKLARGIAEELPFRDASFDFVSMGYAIRHVSDLGVTLNEYCRVLRPGGVLLILEISRPRSGVPFYLTRFYFKSVVPWVARFGTGKPVALTLMRYFWDTVENCVPPETILKGIEEAGFSQPNRYEQLGGLIRDFWAVKA